jgi:hypothetical protein
VKPCKRGHTAGRTKQRQCVVCQREAHARHAKTPKGEATQERYWSTPKGIFALARKRLNQSMSRHSIQLERLLCAVESNKS